MKIVRVAQGIVGHLPTRAGAWAMAAITTHLGYILVMTPTMFHDYPNFGALARIGSATMWGVVLMLVGLTRIMALIVNGTFDSFRYSPHVRACCAFTTCFFWLQFSLSFMSGKESTGAAVYPYLLMLDVYHLYVAAREASQIEEQRRYGREVPGNVVRLAKLGTGRR